MPNSSGHPTILEIRQIQLDEQKRHQQLEYFLPRDTNRLVADICKLATKHCMRICAYANKSLDNRDIGIKAAIECSDLRRETKAIAFTNYIDKYEEVAIPTYEAAYKKAQELFERNYRLLDIMREESETYENFDIAYGRIQSFVESAVMHGR